MRFDQRCEKCDHVWEVTKTFHEEGPECPECGSNFTKTLMPRMKHCKAKDPYDYLGSPMPDSKPIKSFANDRRTGGKDR